MVEEKQRTDLTPYRQDGELLASVLRQSGFNVVQVGRKYQVIGDGASMSIYQSRSGWHFHRWSNTDEHGSVFDALIQYGDAHTFAEASAMIQAMPVREAKKLRALAPKPRPPWARRDSPELERIILNPRKYAAWRSYKPLSPATIDRWSFGLGHLPLVRCLHQRLIYPVYQFSPTGERRLLALRGRAIPGACPVIGQGGCSKWLNSTGSKSTLWNIDGLLEPIQIVVICENPVDAALWMQEIPNSLAVAPTNGVSSWSEDWSGRLAAAARSLAARGVKREYCVWYDCGVEGNPTTEVVQRWMHEHPGKPPPQPAGPKVVRSLTAAGCRAYVYPWPDGTGTAYDLGAYLAEGAA